jgi:hypothetical protein
MRRPTGIVDMGFIPICDISADRSGDANKTKEDTSYRRHEKVIVYGRMLTRICIHIDEDVYML